MSKCKLKDECRRYNCRSHVCKGKPSRRLRNCGYAYARDVPNEEVNAELILRLYETGFHIEYRRRN